MCNALKGCEARAAVRESATDACALHLPSRQDLGSPTSGGVQKCIISFLGKRGLSFKKRCGL